MSDPFFFGYGSLVNRRTHDYPDAMPARIRGWRRAWVHTTTRRIPYLTATPDPTAEIDGLIAGVPGADWAALDDRERAYDRKGAASVAHGRKPSPDIQIYWIPDGKHTASVELYPILLSYLDVVVQGYLSEFGRQGVVDFFATTDGWQGPVLDDRNDPIYPRHQALSAAERRLTDTLLGDYGAGPIIGGDQTATKGDPDAQTSLALRPSWRWT